MEKNIFLEIEYEGTNYFGFQIQNKREEKQVTIQSVLENALKRLFRKEIRVIYTSRTDRGVHARCQGINFKINTKTPLKNIKAALNTFLPQDLKVKKVKRVPLDFHSRFSVESKTYRYIIFFGKEVSVFERNFCWHIPGVLNLEKMERVSKKLIGKRDFSLFAKEAKKYKDCAREVKNIAFKKRKYFLYIDIEADGFLRNMARNIVSFLINIGKQKLGVKQALAILQGECSYVNKSAPPQGLYLFSVKYIKS